MKSKTVFQTGTIGSLVNSVYEGDLSFAELAQHGNFGLGTLDGVDGEMIAFDNEFYQIDSTGTVHKIAQTSITPFSVVTHFEPSETLELEKLPSMAALETYLDSKLPSLNYIYMMRVEGEFPYVKMRSMSCQKKPYKPLVETLDEHQKIFEVYNTQGTMVVTRFPEYLSAINVSGYHIHFLDSDKKQGGHVFDLQLTQAKATIAQQTKLDINFIDNELFAKAPLNKSSSSEIDSIEKQR